MLKERLKEYSDLVNQEFEKIFTFKTLPEKELRVCLHLNPLG